MKTYCHGGDISAYKARFGRFPVDFSINVNPVPLPDRVKQAYIDAFESIEAYPDHRATLLRTHIAEYESVQKDRILCGNGASDIIYKIFYALKPRETLLVAPSFAEYEKAAVAAGSLVHFHFIEEKNGFCLTESILEQIGENCIVFLCNPNNPTGNTINDDLILRILEKCSEKNTLLVIDECFIDFCKKASSCKKYLKKYTNLIIIKAFTKIFGMAGLRLGYCISSNIELLDTIDYAGQSWSVSSPALVCGEAVMTDSGYLQKSIKIINEEKRYLLSKLSEFPLDIYGNDANFIFFHSNIDKLDEKLEKHGIMIRNCSNFKGLTEGFYRIGVRLRGDNEILIEALKHEFSR